MAERYRRFSVSDRAEHAVQIVAFTALAITGLVQRYSGAWLSRRLIDGMGGIETVRVIHRVFATALMVAIVYHVGAIGYRRFVLRRGREMIPGVGDLRAGRRSFYYIRGKVSAPPRQGRFTWEEKLEYWSLVWGTVIMVVTGFLLWNPIATSRLLPGDFIPAAKAAHSGEALLAVLAVVIWHSYHVHFKHLNTAIFTGYMSREQMAEEHPIELEAIEAGGASEVPPPAEKRRRMRVYFPIFAGISLVLLTGVYLFVTFEDTAIATIEAPEQVEIFAPVETTEPTDGDETTDSTLPEDAATWEDGVASIFRDAGCVDCHGPGMPLGGLDLTDRAAVLARVAAGDVDSGPLLRYAGSGDHYETLGEAELEALRSWIARGTP